MINVSNNYIKLGKMDTNRESIALPSFYVEALDSIFFKSIGRPISQILTNEYKIDDVFFKVHGVIEFAERQVEKTYNYQVSYSVDDETYVETVFKGRVIVPSVDTGSAVFCHDVELNNADDDMVHLTDLFVNTSILWRIEIVNVNDENDKLVDVWKVDVADIDAVNDVNSFHKNSLLQSADVNYLTYRDEFGTLNGQLSENEFNHSLGLFGFKVYADTTYKLRLSVSDVVIHTFNLFVDRREVEKPQHNSGFLTQGFTYLDSNGLIEVTAEIPLLVFKEYEKETKVNHSILYVTPKIELLDNTAKILGKKSLSIFGRLQELSEHCELLKDFSW